MKITKFEKVLIKLIIVLGAVVVLVFIVTSIAGCHNHVQAFNFRSVQEADGADTSGLGMGTEVVTDTAVDADVDKTTNSFDGDENQDEEADAQSQHSE